MIIESHPQTDACNIVILGGNGDLALHKLLPALFYLDCDNLLADDSQIIGSARSSMTTADYKKIVKTAITSYLPDNHLDKSVWQRFSKRISYLQLDAEKVDSFSVLQRPLKEQTKGLPTIFYLSTPPALFGSICDALGAHQLVQENTRIVLEKPLGRDLLSSVVINEAVAKLFSEGQVYRIDHYLGKETVQNLLALRFANALFEPVWSNTHINNVQITVAETVGIEGRWSYYDESGALRDMVQNHLLQLLCLVAMGVPVNLDAESVRAEKIKVLKSLKIIQPEEVEETVIRGQYSQGVINGETVPGYCEEDSSRAESQTETFIAARADIHNWRWRGVPFYLRTGKRLPKRYSEIVIQFKDVPHSIFPLSSNLLPNKLIIRLQPDESIQLLKMNKVPGLGTGMKVLPVTLNLTLPDAVTATRVPDAYERLLYDVIRGDSTLFVHRKEVEAAWKWCDAIFEGWQQRGLPPHEYSAGSWGPQTAFELIARHGHTWHESK